MKFDVFFFMYFSQKKDHVYGLCAMEDDNTDFTHLGPINKLFNFLVRWDREGSDSEAFLKHQLGLSDYLWMTRWED
jgi:hypothetical protein